jgi:hypothetical protein
VRYRRLLLFLSAVGLLGLLVSTASAARPEITREPVDEHEVGLEPESSVCGFPINLDVTGVETFELFFDRHGDPVRLHAFGHTTGILSANGIELRFSSRDNKTFNFVDQTVTEVGVVFRYSLPGLGVVLMDRGRLVWNIDENGETVGAPIFEAGPHPELHGDFGGLCAALTP